MTQTQLPKSKAKTAYGLLSEVCAVVLAEPKRLRMSVPLRLNAHEFLDDAPICGTVGCVAGWTVMLKLAPREVIGSTCDAAATILGLTDTQASKLFYEFPSDHGDTSREGSRGHAKAEVKLIRKFQKTHAKQLKAKAV